MPYSFFPSRPRIFFLTLILCVQNEQVEHVLSLNSNCVCTGCEVQLFQAIYDFYFVQYTIIWFYKMYTTNGFFIDDLFTNGHDLCVWRKRTYLWECFSLTQSCVVYSMIYIYVYIYHINETLGIYKDHMYLSL